ncbi:DUF4916 domain-containing protein [Dermabacteraceae bacterium P13095]
MTRTALDAENPWFEPEDIAALRRKLPIPYIDVIPVRVDETGVISEVGLLLRASGEGCIVRSIVSGRVLLHETLREAIIRHVEKDLGPMALPMLPACPTPFTVAEYFPTPMVGQLHDPRQHAISMVYIVPMKGDCAPQQDALDLTWYTVEEIITGNVLDEAEHGHDVLVRRALAHCGLFG